MDVSVRELKNRLSEYLRRVQAGEEVHVTLRGRRVARLLPEPESMSEEDAEAAAVERLRAMPWVIPARGRGKPKGSDQPMKLHGTTTQEIMQWLRD